MAAGTGVVDVVRFTAGGHAFAIEARHVAGMRTEPGDGALPVERILGLGGGGSAPGDVAGRRWLTLRKSATGAACIEVGGPVALASLASDRIFPLPSLLAARLTLRHVAAIAWDGADMLLVLEPSGMA